MLIGIGLVAAAAVVLAAYLLFMGMRSIQMARAATAAASVRLHNAASFSGVPVPLILTNDYALGFVCGDIAGDMSRLGAGRFGPSGRRWVLNETLTGLGMNQQARQRAVTLTESSQKPPGFSEGFANSRKIARIATGRHVYRNDPDYQVVRSGNTALRNDAEVAAEMWLFLFASRLQGSTGP